MVASARSWAAGRAAAAAGSGMAALVVVAAGLLVGTGWLFAFRGLHWFRVGPRLGDALPLLQLAGFDGQPLLRVVLAWLLAGVIAGIALVSWAPRRRLAVAGVLGLIVLVVAAQASYALARNLRFSDALLRHDPGVGPVLEALAFAIGAGLPRLGADRTRSGRRRRSLVTLWTRFDDRGLGGGEHRNGAEHDGDRDHVGDGRRRSRA
jgi:hypothetical protein